MGMALVTWWCTTIGITNLGAIQLAAGVFAGGTLILFGLMILIAVIGAVDDQTARGTLVTETSVQRIAREMR